MAKFPFALAVVGLPKILAYHIELQDNYLGYYTISFAAERSHELESVLFIPSLFIETLFI
jgi:hypothetical protein